MEDQNKTPLSPEQLVIEEKKKTWSGIGERGHHVEMKLQAMAQKAISAVKIPTKFDEIKQAEEDLKALKKSKEEVSTERKGWTKRFADYVTRLMIPENSFDEHINKLSAAMLTVKQAEKKRLDDIKAKDDEILAVRQHAVQALAEVNAGFKMKIANQVLKAFEYALTNKVKPDKVKEYVNKCSEKFTVIDFTAECPPFAKRKILTEVEVEEIILESFTLDSNSHLVSYKNDMQTKFSLYNVDYANAEQALEKSRDDQDLAVTAIEAEKVNEQLVSKLETRASSMTSSLTSAGVKDLKSKYEVNREETSNEDLVKAFIANADVLFPYIGAKAFYDHLAKAIEAHKNKDENFGPSTVTFNKIDKL